MFNVPLLLLSSYEFINLEMNHKLRSKDTDFNYSLVVVKAVPICIINNNNLKSQIILIRV